jgi:hypothetical protein
VVLQCYLKAAEEVGLFDPAAPRNKDSTNLQKEKIYPTAQAKFPGDLNVLVLNLFFGFASFVEVNSTLMPYTRPVHPIYYLVYNVI